MSRMRASRQRKMQGYSTALGRKKPSQGPVHQDKDKWAELKLLRIIVMQTVAALIALTVCAVVDLLAGTHLFGIPALAGVTVYATWRIIYKSRKES